MNLLIVKPGDMDSSGIVHITGERALHIHSVLHGKPGDSIKAGLLNGKTGRMKLLAVSREEVTAGEGVFENEPPEPLPMTLAVALPRPHSFRKTLHFAVSSGIRDIIFFHSARVEKSYWKSSVLAPESIQEEIIEGLEQGFDTMMPRIRFARSFGEFLALADSFPSGTAKIVAHPVRDGNPDSTRNGHILLAIGPEGGFIPDEIGAFQDHSFRLCGFGQHILRVEFASAFIAGALLGQR